MSQSILHKHYADKYSSTYEKVRLQKPASSSHDKKIVINSGFSATADKNHVQYVNDEIAKISGQPPVTTKAKLSISTF